MTNAPDLKALLSDEVTRAALRADGLSPTEFLTTLEAAAQRVAANRRARPASAAPAKAWSVLPFSLACCGA